MPINPELEEIPLLDMDNENAAYGSVSYVNNPSFDESTFSDDYSIYDPIYQPTYNPDDHPVYGPTTIRNSTRGNISTINKLKVSIILGLIMLGITAIALLTYYLTLAKEDNPIPSTTVRPSFSPFTMFPTSQATTQDTTTTTLSIPTTAQQGDKDCLEHLVPAECCWGEPVRNHCI